MLHPTNPVAVTERCPVVADDPADVILDGPASRELGRDGRGREDPPVGESLADWVGPFALVAPGKPLSRQFSGFWRRLGVSESWRTTLDEALDLRSDYIEH